MYVLYKNVKIVKTQQNQSFAGYYLLVSNIVCRGNL
jgi:hypothetical protein